MLENHIETGIDIVIPWVDDSDPEWVKEYLQYKPDANSDHSKARYRDWKVFKYWFRSIEMYAPWIRKIHFITWGHIPEWLDTNNEKIHIVNHKDFIPKKYLPTFSSHTIELNMFRIEGLSENFIYFNDDVYLTKKTEPEDFFKKGRPVDTAIMGVIKNTDTSNFMPYIMLNMMAIINMEFSKREILVKNPAKWFSLKYGKGFLKNIYLSPWNCFTGFMNYHRCNAFKKTTFEKVWSKYEPILNETCMRKFRNKADINQYIMRYWQLCEGDFEPGTPDSAYITIGNKNMNEINEILNDKSYRVVCINDDPMGFDFKKEREALEEILTKKYNIKCSFER